MYSICKSCGARLLGERKLAQHRRLRHAISEEEELETSLDPSKRVWKVPSLPDPEPPPQTSCDERVKEVPFDVANNSNASETHAINVSPSISHADDASILLTPPSSVVTIPESLRPADTALRIDTSASEDNGSEVWTVVSTPSLRACRQHLSTLKTAEQSDADEPTTLKRRNITYQSIPTSSVSEPSRLEEESMDSDVRNTHDDSKKTAAANELSKPLSKSMEELGVILREDMCNERKARAGPATDRNILKKNWREKNRNLFKCPSCDYSSYTTAKVKKHMKTHLENFRCSDCSFASASYTELRVHRSREHPLTHFCSQCDQKFRRRADRDRHFRLNHMNGVPCPIHGCTIRIARNRLKNHIVSCHGDQKSAASLMTQPTNTVVTESHPADISNNDNHSCHLCSFSTLSLEKLNGHIDSEHNRGVTCPMEGCNGRFPLTDLDMHLATMHPHHDSIPRLVDPDMLTESVSESGCLLEEQEISEEEGNPEDMEEANTNRELLGRLDCPKCFKTLGSRDSLRKHIGNVHGKYSKRRVVTRLECPFEGCTKVFKAQTLLDDHINVHNGVIAYECAHCGQSFAARARFAVHLTKYHGESIRNYEMLRRQNLVAL